MLESFADRLHEQMGKSSSGTDYKFEARPEVVANTTVPIIRTKFLGGIPLHISLPRNDPQSLRNTIMIKHYVAARSSCCFFIFNYYGYPIIQFYLIRKSKKMLLS